MDVDKNTYEGHIIDSGYCIEKESDIPFAYDIEITTDKNDDPIGMIFWGGFFSRTKYKDAESRAWVSLVEDCIGQSCDKDIREIHNLTFALDMFGPELDFNCNNFEELKEKLNEFERN